MASYVRDKDCISAAHDLPGSIIHYLYILYVIECMRNKKIIDFIFFNNINVCILNVMSYLCG